MPSSGAQPSRWEVWRGRMMLVVFVLFSLEIGIALTVAPWTPFWTNNSLIVGFPRLQQTLNYDFVRGIVSGLGLTDIWLAIMEAVRYRENVK